MFNELKRVNSYALIGVVLTAANYFLIGWVLIFLNLISTLSFNYSLSFFVSSLIITFFSFILNRKITFKDKNRKSESKWISLLHFYGLYGSTALIVSLVSFVALLMSPNAPLTLLKLGGIVLAVVLNYSGQKLFIYEK